VSGGDRLDPDVRAFGSNRSAFTGSDADRRKVMQSAARSQAIDAEFPIQSLKLLTTHLLPARSPPGPLQQRRSSRSSRSACCWHGVVREPQFAGARYSTALRGVRGAVVAGAGLGQELWFDAGLILSSW